MLVLSRSVRPTRSVNPPPSIYAYKPTASSLSFASSHPVILKRGAMSTARQEEYDYHFDALHLPPKQTEELYEKKIRPVVRAAMRGFNGTVFACVTQQHTRGFMVHLSKLTCSDVVLPHSYGQTASGKTHTMMGSQDEPGIIPLAIDELFSFIHQVSRSVVRSYWRLSGLVSLPTSSCRFAARHHSILHSPGLVLGDLQRTASRSLAHTLHVNCYQGQTS